MTLDAIVKEDGTLIATAPKSLWGKQVIVTIREKKPKRRKISGKPALKKGIAPLENVSDNQESLTQWEKMKAVLQEINQLDLPKRTIDEILHDLHELRESV